MISRRFGGARSTLLNDDQQESMLMGDDGLDNLMERES
jgi:hypothetical protein